MTEAGEYLTISNFDVSLTECDPSTDLSDTTRFKRLSTTGGQSWQLQALLQQIPSITGALNLKDAYIAKFPNGIPHTLTKLESGGYYSMLKSKNGQFSQAVPLYHLSLEAALLGGFSAMSAVTGQYFLTEINKKLNLINLELDQILAFLYGDKRAELVAELNFVKYAHENYTSIASHENQCSATIIELQRARNIAARDIEFYINDMVSKVSLCAKSTASKFSSTVEDTLKIKKSLDFAEQLYATAFLVEIYYAANWDSDYLKYVTNDIAAMIAKCDHQISTSFSELKGQAIRLRPTLLEKDKVNVLDLTQKIQEVIDCTGNTGSGTIMQTVHKTIESSIAPQEYYLTSAGEIYVRKIN